MMRARDWSRWGRRWACGLTWYPYQFCFGGITIRWWPGVFPATVRLHVGPIKVWVAYAANLEPDA